MTIPLSDLGDTPIDRLKTLMARLRDPITGCPWDIEQNFKSIAPYTIEEAYEVSDAIERGDMDDLKEELGDLLLQVIFHARMGEETGHFDFDVICDGLTQKMINRHPHVFDAKENLNAAQQTIHWEMMKANERAKKAEHAPSSLLDDVALALPALMRAEKLQKRAARSGFDWPNLDGVLDKIIEEAAEVKTAYESGHKESIEDEIGDLIFAVTNLARKMDIDPELALRRTNIKFTQRFQYIESQAGDTLSSLDLNAMEALWQAAKAKGL